MRKLKKASFYDKEMIDSFKNYFSKNYNKIVKVTRGILGKDVVVPKMNDMYESLGSDQDYYMESDDFDVLNDIVEGYYNLSYSFYIDGDSSSGTLLGIAYEFNLFVSKDAVYGLYEELPKKQLNYYVSFGFDVKGNLVDGPEFS